MWTGDCESAAALKLLSWLFERVEASSDPAGGEGNVTKATWPMAGHN